MANSKFDKWLQQESLIKITGWARSGLSDEQIAHNMGIRRETLYRWSKKFKKINDALKVGKEVADYAVENALYKRALGFEYEEETWKNGSLIKVVKKFVAPDTIAIIFWLKNRRPDLWRDRQEVEGDSEVVVKMDGLEEFLK